MRICAKCQRVAAACACVISLFVAAVDDAPHTHQEHGRGPIPRNITIVASTSAASAVNTLSSVVWRVPPSSG